MTTGLPEFVGVDLVTGLRWIVADAWSGAGPILASTLVRTGRGPALGELVPALDARGLLWAVDYQLAAIVALDPQTGERVIASK